jgi:thymidylate synthase
MTFNVTVDADGNKTLNGLLNQRSQDMLTANNWNVVQYAVLLQMLAQVCGMRPGKFSHVVADMHIYDRHVETVKKLISQYSNHLLSGGSEPVDDYSVPYPNPKFCINPDIKNFYDFKVSDFALQDYNYLPFDYKIPVAV